MYEHGTSTANMLRETLCIKCDKKKIIKEGSHSTALTRTTLGL